MFEFEGLSHDIINGFKYSWLSAYGIPGKVINIVDNDIWVKTRDNAVILSEIQICDARVEVKGYFKNGTLITESLCTDRNI